MLGSKVPRGCQGRQAHVFVSVKTVMCQSLEGQSVCPGKRDHMSVQLNGHVMLA